MNQNIGKNLMRLRREKGLSAKSVAKMFEVEEKTYISWEMGVAEPSVDDIIKISDAYNIDYAVLFEKTPEQSSIERKPETTQVTASRVNVAQKTNKVKHATFNLGWSITNMVMIFAFCLSLITPIIYVPGTIYDLCYWDLFTARTAWVLVPILFLLISLYFVVDAIIKMSSKTIAEGMYGKVSNIIRLVLLVVLAVCFIVLPCAVGYVDLTIIIPAIFLLLTIIFTTIECVFALKKKEKRVKVQAD